MKLDMANFAINAQRRVLNAHSAEYERDKFAEYLKVKPGKSFLVIRSNICKLIENYYNFFY